MSQNIAITKAARKLIAQIAMTKNQMLKNLRISNPREPVARLSSDILFWSAGRDPSQRLRESSITRK